MKIQKVRSLKGWTGGKEWEACDDMHSRNWCLEEGEVWEEQETWNSIRLSKGGMHRKAGEPEAGMHGKPAKARKAAKLGKVRKHEMPGKSGKAGVAEKPGKAGNHEKAGKHEKGGKSVILAILRLKKMHSKK